MDKDFSYLQKRCDEVIRLRNEAMDLARTLSHEINSDNYFNLNLDYEGLFYSICGDLTRLLDNIVSESDIAILKLTIQREIQDEKIVFEAEKRYRKHLHDSVLFVIECLLKTAKTRRFNDYRARRYQQELAEVMQKLKDVYESMLNEND